MARVRLGAGARYWSAFALLSTSCTGGSDDDASSDTSRSASVPSTSSAAITCRPPAPEIPHEPPRARAVTVFLFCGPGLAPVDLRPVERMVPDDGVPLRAALTQLLLGVTPEESSVGLSSAFSSYTAGQLRSGQRGRNSRSFSRIRGNEQLRHDDPWRHGHFPAQGDGFPVPGYQRARNGD